MHIGKNVQFNWKSVHKNGFLLSSQSMIMITITIDDRDSATKLESHDDECLMTFNV